MQTHWHLTSEHRKHLEPYLKEVDKAHDLICTCSTSDEMLEAIYSNINELKRLSVAVISGGSGHAS